VETEAACVVLGHYGHSRGSSCPVDFVCSWTTKWVPAIAIAAIDSADLIVMLTILSVVGKFMEGRNLEDEHFRP